MKRSSLALILLSSTLCCAAQDKYDELEEAEQRVFKGCVILGMNMTQVDGDSFSGYSKVGIQAGGAVNIRLGQKCNISSELLYTQKGARGAHVYESPYVGTYFDKYYLDLNYVELPLVLQYKHNLLWGFEAGISYGRLIRSKEEGVGYTFTYITPEINYFNNTDVSYIFGAYYYCNKHWMANARFQYSIIPIRPMERVPENYNMLTGQSNNVITIRMVYIL
jgi:hypothetical protein